MKLDKAYRSMIPGGLLVIQEFLLDEDKSGPLVPALFNLMVGAYSSSELIDAIRAAGFANPKTAAADPSIGSAWITAVHPG